MPELIPFPVDRADITPYYEALSAALDGSGPALAPHAAGEAAPTVPNDMTDAPENLALVVATSGSTGRPKRAMLTRDALLASALATNDRIGGAGTWLLPLPPHHIAGTQVIVRSIIAGTTPIVLESWSLEMFVKATALVQRGAPPFSPIHTSLVPTQLRAVLEDDVALTAARRYRSILVGGAATPAALQERARHAGLAIRTTYGSSETAGGCVYDGVPLDGVGVSLLDPDPEGVGRVALTGPTLASGYLGAPDLTEEHFHPVDGRPAFVTDDLGRLTEGHLHIDGRVDDVVNTGGYKVAPRIVEEAVLTVPGISDALCVALPDEHWGETVAVAVVLHAQETAETPHDIDARLLDVCRRSLPPYAVPRRIATFAELPTRGIGKPDRNAVIAHAAWRTLRRDRRFPIDED